MAGTAATFYLAAAVGLLGAVIVGWAMQPPAPPQPVAATAPADPQAPPKTELSMVDKMLVNLGLAELLRPLSTSAILTLRCGWTFIPRSTTAKGRTSSATPRVADSPSSGMPSWTSFNLLPAEPATKPFPAPSRHSQHSRLTSNFM